MTTERTQPKALQIQSAPEKQLLPAPTSSTVAQNYQNEYDELLHSHSEHSGAPPLTPLPTQPSATRPHDHAERDQDLHLLPQGGEQQAFDPFIFVNEQELQRSRNNELRRAVRSHVRKGTHIKQRRLNAASRPGSNSVKKILKRPSGVESSNNTKSRDLPYKTHSRPTPLPVVENHSAGRLEFSSNLPVDSRWREKSPEAAVDTAISGPHTSEAGLGAVASNVIVQPLPENFSQISRHQLDSNTPYSLLLGDGAPLLYLQARNWPFPQPLRGPSPAISVWMPSVTIPVPNSRNPRPCLLRSAGTVPWIINSFDYFLFKDETIRWVNQQLQQPNHGTSDTTMGVIVCLMTWETARGNITEITHHMKGLQRIINLRGNIPDAKHFNWKLQFVDLLVAIMTSTEPRINFQFHRPTPPPFENPSLGSPQIADSPLYGSEPLSTVLTDSKFCEQSVKILQDMRDLTDILQFGSHHSAMGLDRRRDQSFPSRPSSISLLRVVHLTSTIYNRALSEPPVMLSSSINHRAMEEICRDLEDTSNDDTWIRYPGILLWIILTAGSAAEFRAERSFFIMFLMRVGTSAVWWGPEEARMSLLRFLWVKKRSERSAA